MKSVFAAHPEKSGAPSRPFSSSVVPTRPPSQYRASFWTTAVSLARILPARLLNALATITSIGYAKITPIRREIVTQNLLPVLDGNWKAAAIVAQRTFRNFGQKLADLWRFEANQPIAHLFHTLNGWEHLQSAQAQGRGILLVTIHLGNWEFGAPLLTQRGVALHVITAPEPDPRLTVVRQAARARWGIETIALGDGPFAAVEIIRRLATNAAVALLLDRPTEGGAVAVQFFGRTLMASSAAADLARATGAALLPVYLVRDPQGYRAEILREVPYERAELRDAGVRLALTQRLMTTFEPAVRAHPDQWYHFVPIWT